MFCIECISIVGTCCASCNGPFHYNCHPSSSLCVSWKTWGWKKGRKTWSTWPWFICYFNECNHRTMILLKWVSSWNLLIVSLVLYYRWHCFGAASVGHIWFGQLTFRHYIVRPFILHFWAYRSCDNIQTPMSKPGFCVGKRHLWIRTQRCQNSLNSVFLTPSFLTITTTQNLL